MYRLIVSCYTSTFLSKPFFGLFKFHRATSSASIKANANDYSSLSSAEKCQSDNESPSVITVKSNPNLKDEEQHLEQSNSQIDAVLSPIVERLGKLRVNVQYSIQKRILIITIVEGIAFESIENDSNTQIRMVLLPYKNFRYRTKFASGLNPKFNETFFFKNINQEDLSKTFVRFRIYKRRLTGRNQFIGETLLRNSLIDAKNGCLTHHTLLLHSKTDANLARSCHVESDIVDHTSDPLAPKSPTNSIVHSALSTPSHKQKQVKKSYKTQSSNDNNNENNYNNPKLLLSFSYSDGKMFILIDKGGNLNYKSKYVDTFVKLYVKTAYDAQTMVQQSHTIKACCEPVFDAKFSFAVSKQDIDSLSISIRVCTTIGLLKRRINLGTLEFGSNVVGEEERAHWQEFICSKKQTSFKWHRLTCCI
ncbi:unnamed protein product [Dracunculus medinensis]|uniref:C2 domain-containing protein n=1 Tax=Dracunculus medinensis TaxID=318479 RepID=A0A0N4U4L4_DRAME|nr:unnamed protein product [Dracunculus medinensis]